MKLIVICGATATGKSGLALNLAQKYNSVILSADSRQVYKDFNIGTAKPTLGEQKLISHYLIDICEANQIMTVADYQELAQGLIANFDNLDVSPLLLVGGTGLYIRAIVQGMMIPRVAPNLELRSQLESLGQYQLYQILKQVDPASTKKIHSHDLVRTLRALEVYYVTGLPISELQGENPPQYPILQIGLDSDAENLTQRIYQRTQKMIADGLVAEVEYLINKYGRDLPLLNTLGYQEIKQYLLGEISLETAIELTGLHTKQFAKRQRTWFRGNKQIEWFNFDDVNLLEKVEERINEFLHK